MTITITAENIQDAADKLGLNRGNPDIRIRWRRLNGVQSGMYGPMHDSGCVVDAIGFPGEEAARSFKNPGEALRYLGALMRKHDALAKKARAQNAKQEREYLKKQAKKSSPCR